MDEELWNAVQAKLTGNLTRRRQARIESGAVLGGVIFDDRGNRMSPTYTMRRGSRYRYYVSQAQLRGKQEGSRPRIGADDVERLIVEQMCRQQQRDDLAADMTTGVWSAETRELILSRLDRVIVHHDEIEVTLKNKGEGSTAASAKPAVRARAKVPSGFRCPLPVLVSAGRYWFRAIPGHSLVASIGSSS